MLSSAQPAADAATANSRGSSQRTAVVDAALANWTLWRGDSALQPQSLGESLATGLEAPGRDRLARLHDFAIGAMVDGPAADELLA